MVLNNRTLLLDRTTEVCTMRDDLVEKKGWVVGKRYWMRNACWGYVRDVDSSKGSYSITSGLLQAGTSDVGRSLGGSEGLWCRTALGWFPDDFTKNATCY